jgi:hypothetical protein
MLELGLIIHRNGITAAMFFCISIAAEPTWQTISYPGERTPGRSLAAFSAPIILAEHGTDSQP